MKVKELIKRLKKMPEDYTVFFHEKGGVFDSRVTRVDIDHYDKKNGRERVTLKG